VFPRETLEEQLNRAGYALRRLTVLIAEMLDGMNFLQNRPLGLLLQRTDLQELVLEVLQEVWQPLGGGALSDRTPLQLDLPPGPVKGDWDRARIKKVLVDLLDNAVKFSPNGGEIRVRLAVEALHEGRLGPWAHISVSDSGIGIPLGEQALLFHAFFRASNTPEWHYPGLGLGLVVCREIVELHHGRIWAESAGENLGSTFHVVLRCAPPEDSAA
jgi:signal transduction histidine kinase